jgi:DNA-binding GntR family transcriptional regulator
MHDDPAVEYELGRPLWAEVFDLLRTEIDSQRLRPGERLLEVDLAERFGVSRGPVRSALVELQRIGLVEINPRRGAHVATLTARDAEELYELRTALEIQALDGVLRRCTKSRIAELAEPLRRHQRAVLDGNLDEAITADLAFHRLLCHLSGNARLERAWEAHADQFRLVIGAVQNDARWQARPRVQEHQEVLDALLADDLDAATAALRKHLDNARDVMISVAEGADSKSVEPRRTR